MRNCFLIMAATALCLTGGAQELLTLTDFRDRVVQRSNDVQISLAKSDMNKSKFKATRTGFYPSLTVGAGANYFLGNPAGAGVVLKDYTYNANLTLQQTVYGGHAVANATKAAKIEWDIALLNEKQTLDNVLYEADVTYWALVASDKQLGVMQRYVSIVESLYGIVSDRFANGYISRTDLLMVETRLNEARLQQLSARKLRDNSLQNLNSVMNNISIVNYVPVDTLTMPQAMPEFRSLDEALQGRSDYLMAQRNIDLQNQNVRSSRAKFNPQLVAGVQGVYGTLNPNYSGQSVGYGVAFVNFTAPILHFGERRHTVAVAKAGVNIAMLSADDLRTNINRELGNAMVNIEQTFAQTQIAESNLRIAHENLELNTYSYSEGRLPILDVLSAQLAWIQSYTAAVNSSYEYRVALADYVRSLGVISLD